MGFCVVAPHGCDIGVGDLSLVVVPLILGTTCLKEAFEVRWFVSIEWHFRDSNSHFCEKFEFLLIYLTFFAANTNCPHAPRRFRAGDFDSVIGNQSHTLNENTLINRYTQFAFPQYSTQKSLLEFAIFSSHMMRTHK